ncbi:MAG: DUF3089 domain-containing protein, partial [Pseudomonadota bacterium]|nr:DUF3089 domain-containing protein [Pseudomonadota bacterium]
ALDLAYSDVERAFDEFLARTGSDRPFVLAGHSQGSALLLRLLVERLSGTPLMSRLVAAYLPGWSIDGADLSALRDMPLCETAERVGCLAAWNSEGEAPRGQLVDLTQSDTACVNPLSWKAGGEWAHATSSQVSWRWYSSEEEELPPPTVASVVDARCAGGALVVTPPSDRRFRNGFAEDALLGREVYHNVDYALFYGSIRENAVVRVHAWQAERQAQ